LPCPSPMTLVYWSPAMTYQTVIGLEVHAQLLTRSKMFCSCSTDYAGAHPNTHVCPICLGMPGTLPVINEKAIEYTIMTALALNCNIPEYTEFDRKNYFYPDLMKGYQISQHGTPIGRNGWLTINSNGEIRKIGIADVHLEEDVAKLWHRKDCSLIDVNRSGVPLMEIVSEPDMESAVEARDYLVQLRSILRYLGVSTGNMEEGSFRCDANISVRLPGSKELTPKTEIKNMNSFKAVQQALEYESRRQVDLLEQGGSPIQETRGWIEQEGRTVSQRTKELAGDYRYFPEPDLPPLVLNRDWIERIRAGLPELPVARRDRLMAQYGLSLYDASLLTASRGMADYFENCMKLVDPAKAKAVSNWLLGDFSRLLNATNIEIERAKIVPRQLIGLLALADDGTVSGPAAKIVFEEMFATGRAADEVVAEKKLGQISGKDEIREAVRGVLAVNSDAVADYASGKQQALTFIIGQVMRATGGRANPGMVREIIVQELGGK